MPMGQIAEVKSSIGQPKKSVLLTAIDKTRDYGIPATP